MTGSSNWRSGFSFKGGMGGGHSTADIVPPPPLSKSLPPHVHPTTMQSPLYIPPCCDTVCPLLFEESYRGGGRQGFYKFLDSTTFSPTHLQLYKKFLTFFYIYNYLIILMYFSTIYNKNTNKSTEINTFENL